MGDERDPKDIPASGTDGDEKRLSAAFLPYDDERLWVSMPPEERGLRARFRRRKRSAEEPSAEAPTTGGAGEPPGGTPAAREPEAAAPEVKEHAPRAPRRTARRLDRRLLVAAVVLLLPLAAFAVTRAVIGGGAEPTPTGSTTPSLTPSPVVIDITGLATTKVSSERVALRWDALESGGDLTYTVYRDGTAIWETTEPTFIDISVEAGGSYYYAIATVLPDGTVASTEQLQVTVPSPTSASPTAAPRPTASPSRIVTAPPPSPTRSPSPQPSKSKIVWPSIDLGSGTGGGSPTP